MATKTRTKLPEGPTLNVEYNGLLVAWKAQGCKGDPSCEDCGVDLTGKQVYETRGSWLGACCATPEEIDFAENGPDDSDDEHYLESSAPSWWHEREDFHADC